MENNPNNPFHGVKLETILEYLVAVHTWAGLGERINIKCFQVNPSIKSSLAFLRTTSWAREKVENLYLETKQRQERNNALPK